MRHSQNESHVRRALFAIQDSDGYVEALLEMARDQLAGRHLLSKRSNSHLRLDAGKTLARGRAALH